MVEMGTYAELLSSSVSFAHLLEDINQQQQEQQQPNTLRKQLSKVNSVNSEKEEDGEDVLGSVPTNEEIKQEGTVKWGVYASYLRASGGVCISLSLIIVAFFMQQAAFLYANWWLAQWNDDEGYRHHVMNNCTDVFNPRIWIIRSMNETEWDRYRAHRFYRFFSNYPST